MESSSRTRLDFQCADPDRRGSVEDVRSYIEEDAHSYTEATGHVGHSLRVIMTCIRIGSADSKGSVERFFIGQRCITGCGMQLKRMAAGIRCL